MTAQHAGGGPARDRAAEIEAAFEAVLGEGPVSVSVTGAVPERSVVPVFPGDVDPAAGGWFPFAGATGELSAAGPVLYLGLGPRDAVDAESVRRAGRAAGALLCGGTVGLTVPAALDDGLVRALVDGLATGHTGAATVRLVVPETRLEPARLGLVDAAAGRLAALLTSAPANLVTPERFAAWADRFTPRAGLRCAVRDADQLRADGFGALDAIGRGSRNGPRLVELEYRGGGRTFGLAGKGITFDSGGLSLKSPASMMAMRMDMAGAAVVLAVMCALQRLGCRATVRAVLPLAENLPGPDATRPGDVVTAWNGTQIQVLDTDFEGRVVLADALALAAADRPDLLVDVATLTYQAEVALGPEIGALVARDDAAATEVLGAAAAAGEPLWRLPWAPRYLDQVRTPSGVRNHPLVDSGRALTAALFLGEFVPAEVPWAHLDIAGPSWAGDASVDGATGFAARTLLRLVTTT